MTSTPIQKSPLSYPEYHTPSEKLPRAKLPWWINPVALFSVAGTGLFSYLTMQGNMDEYVSASGEIRPADYTIIFSTAPGILHELLVRDGEEVQAGQTIARVWFLPEQQAIDPGGLRPFEVKSHESGRVVSTARLFQGERVLLGAPLVKLVRGKEREIRIYATEDRIDRIKPGQKVRFRVRSNPDRLAPPAYAIITSVARDRDLMPEDKATPTRPTYYVKARVVQAEFELPLGARIDAEILLTKRQFWELIFLQIFRRTPSQSTTR